MAVDRLSVYESIINDLKRCHKNNERVFYVEYDKIFVLFMNVHMLLFEQAEANIYPTYPFSGISLWLSQKGITLTRSALFILTFIRLQQQHLNICNIRIPFFDSQITLSSEKQCPYKPPKNKRGYHIHVV